jgi:hypothetical protein
MFPFVFGLLAHMMPVRFGCGLSLGMPIWLRVSDIYRVFDPVDIDMEIIFYLCVSLVLDSNLDGCDGYFFSPADNSIGT